ncbi:MAG: PAS domain S-box protein [Isosphaeraceae bacterium]
MRFVPAVPFLSAAPTQGERAGGPSDRPALGPSDRPTVFVYLVVILGVVLATVARGASLKSGGHQLALLLFTFPVAYAAWCAGTRTSLLTLIVSVFVLAIANDPQGRSLAHDPDGQLGLVLFALLGLVIVAMGDSNRRTRLRVESYRTVAKVDRCALETEILGRQRAENLEGDLKQQEQDLQRKSAEQAALIGIMLNQPSVGISILDNELRIAEMSAHCRAARGESAQVPIGRRFHDVLLEVWGKEVAANLIAECKAVLETGKPFQVRERALEPLDREGQPCVADWSISRIEGLSGEPAGLILITVETTGQKTLEKQRNQLLEEIEAREAFTEAILRQVPAGIIVADANTGGVFLSNHEAERILHGAIEPGLQMKDYDQRLTFIGLHADGSRYEPQEWPIMRALRQGEVVQDEEIDLVCGDGSRLTIGANAGPVLGASGQVVAAVAAFHDITDRKQAERLSRENEARFRHLADAIPQIVWIAHPDQSLLYLNRRWFEYTGLSEDDAYHPEAWKAIVHPEDLPSVLELAARSKDGGDPFVAEYRLRDWTGSYRWFLGRAVPVFDKDGNLSYHFGTATDIDDRKRAEQSARFLAGASATLAELVDETRTLQQVAHLAVCHFADWCAVDIASEGGLFARVAIAHTDSQKVAIAQELHRRYPTDPGDCSGVAQVLRTGEPELVPEITDLMLVARARDEDHLRILRELGLRSSMVIPLRGRSGTLGTISFVAAESQRTYGPEDLRLAQDLADRAAIAIENARLYARVKDADHRKDEFLATLAHELRNPLAPIRTALHLMSRPDLIDYEAERAMAERLVIHLTRLVDDLMDVARINKGTIELRKEVVPFGTIVERAVQSCSAQAGERGVDLSVSLTERAVLLEADPIRLEQILWNLLDNAIKYTEPGGRISLAAECQDLELVVRVSDSGVGIKADVLPLVFDMFTRVEPVIGAVVGGLGIGLGLVKKLVELHGGTIEAHSEGPGKGSQFTIRLPMLAMAATPRQESRHQALEKRSEAVAGRLRILVVDDNEDAARSLARLLATLDGHEVRVAYSGPSAIALAGEFGPNVVILDLGMPEMNGFEVARRLKARSEFRSTRLLALSGWGQDKDREQSSAAGFEHHLVKPVDLDLLRELLSQPAEKRAAECSLPASSQGQRVS